MHEKGEKHWVSEDETVLPKGVCCGCMGSNMYNGAHDTTTQQIDKKHVQHPQRMKGIQLKSVATGATRVCGGDR